MSLRSILGEDDEKQETKRDIRNEWFNYLDALAYDCYSTGRPTAILPHKKLLTFGGAASCADRWPMCGNWIEGSRIFKMNTAGVKRACCLDENRAYGLVVTEVTINTHLRCYQKSTSLNGLVRLKRSCATCTKTKIWP